MDFIPNGISVVIPTYNRAHLIKESLQSVLDQTVQPLEIIVVDDFSTDNTEEVVKSLNSPLIQYVKNQRTKGANGARNTGIMLSRGEFIAFHDSDDIWLSEKLKLQKKIMDEDESIDMCFCTMELVGGRVVPIKQVSIESIPRLIKKYSFISTQTIFVKKSLTRDILFDENLKRYQDWDFVLRCVNDFKIYHLNEILVKQNASIDSISNNVDLSQAGEAIIKKHPYLKDSGIHHKVFIQEIYFKKRKNYLSLFYLNYLKLIRKIKMLIEKY